MQKNKPAYILVLTLMIISVLTVVVTGVFYNSTAQIAFTKVVLNRERAKILALSGMQIAASKLILPKEQEKKKEGDKDKAPKDSEAKKLLNRILPKLNRWQIINLKEDKEGIDAQIKVCITSEDGKINLNKLFDFKAHKFLTFSAQEKAKTTPESGKPAPESSPGKQADKAKTPPIDARQFMQTIFSAMTEFLQSKDLFADMQTFLQKRKWPLNDITELVTLPKFEYFRSNLFYQPLSADNKKAPIYLTDIFTTWTDTEKVQPWLFTDSVCAVLGLKRVKYNDDDERGQLVDQWLKNFNDNIDWQKDWDKTLKPVYGKEFKSLPKNLQFFLSNKIAPKIFSVTTHATVGSVTQRLIVILEISSGDDKESATFVIKKIYWN